MKLSVENVSGFIEKHSIVSVHNSNIYSTRNNKLIVVNYS